MENKVIDCVVLNYNDADTTIDMLNHISGYDCFDHIIVVDNLSTDDSLQRLEKMAGGKVTVVCCDKNGGYGAGNNFGVFYSNEHFHSDYVLISNPDVIFDEECIVKLAELMDGDDRCAVCAPVQLDAKGEIIRDYAWPFPTVWGAISSAGHYLRLKTWKCYGQQWLADKKAEGAQTAVVDCVPGAMLMVRTGSFCDISGYDERNFLYWEEAMLGKKVAYSAMHTKLLVNYTYLHNHSVSINKSIPKAINQIKLLLKGRYHYLKYYSGANAFQLFIARVFFRICIIEESIIAKLKNI